MQEKRNNTKDKYVEEREPMIKKAKTTKPNKTKANKQKTNPWHFVKHTKTKQALMKEPVSLLPS